ncbi:PREDICTED: probable LRR receptor-like serine/threonine-protein kinase At5g48740 isoform X2 [Nelumbo nucifera]|uniref:Probable LRR receptor-like serine/threonine-protein kinase At5g48740 isoform X2 n=1 Tax=Nelumbo nucifera TaxID=4432 RepID=A0A1U8A9L1_NELNU|nr:PREDICTED: probable LRR receptor-like serine/threonine-protein kinase At5g48740 isoform X2 [Nelumbo nucifera]
MDLRWSCLGFLLIYGFSGSVLGDQEGFLSLSCGGSTSFVDSSNISWVPDDDYVSTGNGTTVNFIEGSSTSRVPLRFFLDSQEGRKCYKLPVKNISSVVLIRPQFFYKNYDGLGKPPAFQVSLGTATITTVNLTNSDPWVEEFIWPVTKDTVPFCFLSILDGGVPVISSLEVRPLPDGAYRSGMGNLTNKSLRKHYRVNCGNNTSTRFYPQVNAIEVYEIVDIPLEASSTTVSALQVIQQSTGLDLGWQDDPCAPTPWKHIGCEGSLVTSLEIFGIDLRAISPTFGDLLDLKTLDLHNTSLTGEIQNLGSLQQLEKLNLSFNHLTSFGSDFATLVSLQILDLQNNSLQGTVPDNLGNLKGLHLLNLENNKLQGTLPQSLNRENLEVRTSGNICLSFSTLSCNDIYSNSSIETPHVTMFNPTKHNGHNRKALIIGITCGVLCALLFIAFLVFIYRREKGSKFTSTAGTSSEMRNWNATKVLTCKEIKAATSNFKEIIGRGSFGSVYLGKLQDGKLVAVKVRFDQTPLGADSFINEVYLLSQVRHQNLVSLEGFCHESKQQILIYEYLSGGSLADNLYGSNSKNVTLSWVRRLKIAVDAAKGLDYLHNGSNPRIIHRDVKSSNILLDSEMNAKVCDFGLSKQISQADVTHVTTVVKGTAGYLDPEYYSTQQLTEKSDVYSFGVVLLELICGREPLCHSGNPDSYNLVLWAKPYLQAGAFEIVDDCLKGTFDMESMRRAASVAARSVERDASQRPTMAEVLAELKEAYGIQLSYVTSRGHLN